MRDIKGVRVVRPGRVRQLALLGCAAALVCAAFAASSLARASDTPRRPPRPHPLARPFAVTTTRGTFHPITWDGHVHTRYSPDAVMEPRDVLALGQRHGLDAILFTDHGSTRAAGDVQALSAIAKSAPGEEIGGVYGHAVTWNTPINDPAVPARTSLAERSAYAHRSGGVIVLAHPGWWIRGNDQDPAQWMTADALRSGGLSAGIDAIEIWNGQYERPTRKLVEAWADLLDHGVFVPVVGDSDFHDPRFHRIGHPHNVALCTTPDVACILDATKHGRVYITDGPALGFSANDALSGDVVSGEPGSELHVSIEAISPGGGTLLLYLGHDEAERVTLDPHEKTSAAFDLKMPAEDSYLRVEIEQPTTRPGRGGPVLMLLSNPILLDPTPARASWR
jgi:hypothetical protein